MFIYIYIYFVFYFINLFDFSSTSSSFSSSSFSSSSFFSASSFFSLLQFYDEMDDELVSQLVNVNLLSSYFMTKLVLPGMKEKKKGLILFVSTGSSVIKSCPLLTIYASVKSAINSFATSLSVELRPYKINVHCHVPLFVTTKLSKIKRTSLFVPSPEVYAKSALKQIKRGNIICTNVISSPYCYHKIQTFLFNLAPKFLCDSLTLQLHKKLRALALRKMKKSE